MKIDGYKFGDKNNWRRWVWNRICERLTKPRRDAVVVYLPGKEDLDRKVAVERGFSPYNLIAVDRSPSVVSIMKAKGALCIEGNLIDVLQCFKNTNVRVDVVLADLCCGLVDDVNDLARKSVV